MRLLGRTGKLRGQTVAVSGTTRMGRGPENQLQVMADGVSRRHAQIVADESGFWLEDLGSANGTLLNGQPVKRERLEHLDIITLAPGADIIVDTRRSDEVASTTRMARPAAIFLQTMDGPQEGTRIDLKPGELTIGRTAPANLLVENAAVSKVHARLRRTVNSVILEDFQSANGTFVNGERVTEAVALKDGDRISVAGLRSFRVSISAPEGTVAAPEAPAPVGSPAAAAAPATDPARPAETFDQEWRTRLEWSPEELAALDVERARAVADVAQRAAGGAPLPAAARTQHYTDLPLPPPAAPSAASRSETDAAPKTQHFDSMPTPPAMPVLPAAPRTPPAAAPPAADRTQHFDSMPTPPAMRRPPAPPPAAAPGTQLFNSPPEPPAPGQTPAASAPPASARPAPAPAAAEAATQKYDPANFPPLVSPPAPAAAPPQRIVRLRGAAGEYVLRTGAHTVGRQETCAIAVIDRQVSRTHAIVTVSDSGISVEDKASANGTFVNGKRISGSSALTPGDRLSFGGVEFKVEAD